ncbi:MAG TPA: hypothetical protein VKE24_14570, partial [Candidatus Acidoferrales bacterium]|nr:hypothetical protein [Candidatus Acidoferrales bacterium]
MLKSREIIHLTHVETIRLFPKDRAGLLAYLERFNAACDWLSAIAFREGLWHWLPLQRRTYPELRGKVPTLSRRGVGGHPQG